MFSVYDNGRLARYPEQRIHDSWANATFHTLEEAIIYARHYFDPYPSPEGVGKVDYSGYGDIAEIREE